MQVLILIFGILVLFALAMGGLALGVMFQKRTPLKGSCHGPSCETHRDEGCGCGG